MDTQHLINVVLAGLTVGAIYAMLGMGFDVTYSTTNVFNFAHGEFLMVGAMLGVFFAVSLSWPLILALIAAIAAAVVLALIEERWAVRPVEGASSDSHAWFLSTLGFSIIVASGFAIVMGSDARRFPSLFSETPTRIGDVRLVPQNLAVIALALLMAGGLTILYSATLTGQALGAIAQDRDAAALRGIPVARLSMISFGLSGALGAVCGFMIAPLTSAYPAMGAVFLFKGFVAAALGGIPNVRGALIGGLMLGVLESLSGEFIGPGYRDAATLVVLLAVLMVKPAGILGSRASSVRLV